jgi:hypothetical protein
LKRGTPDHPKTVHVQQLLGCLRHEVVGYLELLFHWTAKYSPRGDLGKWSDQAIADGVGWRGEPSALVAALVEAGWLDRDPQHRLLVHDWHEHADEAVKISLKRKGLELDAAFYRPGVTPRPAAGAPAEPCRDAVATVSRQRSDSVATASRPPLPEPLPEPEPEPDRSLSSCSPARETEPAGAPAEVEAAAAADDERISTSPYGPYLSALERLYPESRAFAVESAREALASVRTDLPDPVEFAVALWIWSMSEDWREKGGRFVPPVERWIHERRWRTVPRSCPLAEGNSGRRQAELAARQAVSIEAGAA